MLGPVLLLCYVSGVWSAMLGPCKKEDQECFVKSVNEVTPIVYSGIPSLGVPSSDPMFADVIDGNLSILKYKFTNTTVKGYKDCSFKNIKLIDPCSDLRAGEYFAQSLSLTVKRGYAASALGTMLKRNVLKEVGAGNAHDIQNNRLDLEGQTLYYEMDCPSIAMNGNYEINGRLIILPVEGQGTFEIITTRYLIPVDCEIKVYKKNGKSYVTIKNFKIKPHPQGPIKFLFNNLFNGRKDLSDAVHKFAHESWGEVAELVQDPIFKKCIKIVISNYNKFLKYEALEDVFVN